MSRYRQLHCLIWNDDKFPFVSDDCQLVFFHLLTTPFSSPFGLYKASLAGLAAEKRWPLPRYTKAFQEAQDVGFVAYDEHAQVVYLPQFLRYNPPGNPNVLTGWERQFSELPRGPLLLAFLLHLEERLPEFGKGKGLSFHDAFDKVWRRHIPADYVRAEPVVAVPDMTAPAVAAVPEPALTPEIMPEEDKTPVLFDTGGPSRSPISESAMIQARAMAILTYLNQVHGTKFRNAGQIPTALRNGATTEDCKLIIDFCWAIDRLQNLEGYNKYFDPTTPFRTANFDARLGKAQRWHDAGRPSYEEMQSQQNTDNPVRARVRAGVIEAAERFHDETHTNGNSSLFGLPVSGQVIQGHHVVIGANS